MFEVDEVLRIAGRLEAMADEGKVRVSPMEARALAFDLRIVARDCDPRRTCSMRDVGDKTEQVYRCSECGEEYCMSDIKQYPWRFCPMCGAEVLDEDGAN